LQGSEPEVCQPLKRRSDKRMQDTIPLRVDLVSDVVCPWCIIGYLQFDQALQQRGDKFELDLQWHPFELNPQMPAEGQDIREHMAQKYGATAEQSKGARQRMTEAGRELGFVFGQSEGMRMVNTFHAHQLLHWAQEQGQQTALKLALFRAYFTQGKDVSDIEVLVEVAAELGLPAAQARAVLMENTYAEVVRTDQRQWLEEGIQAVPCFIINREFMVQGAQGVEGFGRMLDKLLTRAAA
jgi:predicted DsbA family dithiol-disulfide isomerase